MALLAVVGAVGLLAAATDSSGSKTVSAAASATESQSGSLSSSSAVQEVEEKPWLGVTLALTPDGVTIAHVIADSPADAAGLQRGDVIEAVDGTDVDDVRDFRDQLDGKNLGDTVTLAISRDGQRLTLRPEGDSRFVDEETGTAWSLLGQASPSSPP